MRDRHAANKSIAVEVGSQTAVVLVGTIVAFISGMANVWIITKYVGVELLGIVGVIDAAVQLLGGVLGGGLGATALRYLPAYMQEDRFADARALVRVGVLFVIAVSFLGVVAVQPIIGLVGSVDVDAARLYGACGLLKWTLPASMLSFFAGQALRGLGRIKEMVFATNITGPAVKLAILALYLGGAGLDDLGVVRAILLSNFATAVILCLAIWRALPVRGGECDSFERRELRTWFSFATTSWSGSVLNAITGSFDRFLVTYMLGTGSNGVLMVVRQVSSVLLTLQNMLRFVVAPMFSSAHSVDDYVGLDRVLWLSADWGVKSVVGLSAVFLFAPDAVLAIYGVSVENETVWLLRVFVGASMVNLATGATGMLLTMTGSHGVVLKITAIASAINALLLLMLGSGFGLLGVGLAFLCSMCFTKWANAVMVRDRMRLSVLRSSCWLWVLYFVACLVSCAIASFLSSLLPVHGASWSVAWLLFFSHLALILVLALRGLDEDDAEVLAFLKRRAASLCGPGGGR